LSAADGCGLAATAFALQAVQRTVLWPVLLLVLLLLVLLAGAFM